jgi:hypothetical protein
VARDDIIRMAREARGYPAAPTDGSLWLFSESHLERFAELVAAAEREKSLRLWMLLDDVDTADDIAKADDAVYRSLCRKAHAKRWGVLNGDEVDAAIRAKENT